MNEAKPTLHLFIARVGETAIEHETSSCFGEINNSDINICAGDLRRVDGKAPPTETRTQLFT